MNNKTCEAIGRLESWVREYGSRSQPPFLDDLKTVIEAAKGKQRQELVRRFAVALVGTEWCYNPEARDFTPDKVWEWAAKLADVEPKIEDEPINQRQLVRYHGKDGTVYYGRTIEEAIQEACDDNERE